MRTSAKHKLLAGTMFTAFLLVGCDNAVTGPGEPLELAEPEVQEPREAPDQSVKPDGCFRFNGEEYCPRTGSELRRRFGPEV
jgi:hypothetical protein